MIVDFTTADGRRVRARVDGTSKKPGTTIRVRYLPEDPGNDIEEAGSNYHLWAAMGPALGAVIGGVLTVGIGTGRLAVRGRRIIIVRRGRTIKGV